ncbi:MAG: Fe-S cluster assembly ATPase SufC [Atopobium sp.]|nr:Fe-S cluster assembly ATPase SufC [Atopobium sp.]
MATELLRVNGISAGTEEKSILHSIDLSIGDGQAHVLMGPNGAGKSTLGRVIMGDPTYKITEGSLIFNGEDVTELAADKRSLAGIFLSYQAPVEVPGVPLYSFLRTITQMRPELKMTARQFRQRVGQISDHLELDQGFLMRELNVGFSGGEKKKVEMLQLLLLQPKLAILDETDSGLDVDALSVVSKGIQAYRETCGGSLLIITHNTRILERLEIDRTHVMVKGHLVADGPADLINQIDHEGFERFENQSDEGGAN